MLRPLIVSIAIASLCQSPARADVALTPKTQLHFAAANEARGLLAVRDDYVERMSPFDRAARLKTDREVSEAEYLDFVGKQTLDWPAEERAKIEQAVAAVAPRVAELGLPLPERIELVRTTGLEEGGAYYTRGAAIVFPAQRLARDDEAALKKIFAHELFHVLTRANLKLRRPLYAVIGYEPCDEIGLPDELEDRKITNPDAPRNDHFIRLKVDGEDRMAVPILYSRTSKYDPARGGEFFDYLEFRFLPIAKCNFGFYRDGDVDDLLEPAKAENLFEQIGRNTQYIIHPEEVLADNFALLVLSETEVETPELLRKLEQALRQAVAKGD